MTATTAMPEAVRTGFARSLQGKQTKQMKLKFCCPDPSVTMQATHSFYSTITVNKVAVNIEGAENAWMAWPARPATGHEKNVQSAEKGRL